MVCNKPLGTEVLCETPTIYCSEMVTTLHFPWMELTETLVWEFNRPLLHIIPHDRLAYAVCSVTLHARSLWEEITHSQAHIRTERRESGITSPDTQQHCAAH